MTCDTALTGTFDRQNNALPGGVLRAHEATTGKRTWDPKTFPNRLFCCFLKMSEVEEDFQIGAESEEEEEELSDGEVRVYF